LLSQGIHAWADASYYVPVTAISQQLPVYKGLTAKKFLTRNGFVDASASRERELAKRLARSVQGDSRSSLSYPLNELQCNSEPRMNLLLVLVDAMRSDMLTEVTAPNISRYAATKATNFSEHFSGGNSSRMGAFSLFYGLPPGYWSSFESLQRSSVLVDRLQSEGFQLGIFSSQTMYRPVVLDRTAFANVSNLRMGTEPLSDPAWKRDQKLTEEWFTWLSDRDSAKPFFGFLFYDAATVKKPPPDYPVRFTAATDDPQQQRLAEYKTAVHFNDSLIGQVLDDLQHRGLSENTVVIISSDHGEEFDDSGAGLEKHGSGYSRYQLQTPMVVAWPGRSTGEVFTHRTSHYDIVPTLMQDLLGCDNPATDYSVGNNLFEQQPWNWLIAGSYYNYAVLEPDKITITYPNGGVEVRDWDYKLLDNPEFDGDTLSAVAEQNTRFHSR
jgi:membrane-anchored protein YejM (alkaline phosphatase superfamily)